MSVILSQSEHDDQQAAGMVLAGDLTIPSGSHLRASGMVSLESGTLTIEDGAILEIDDQPPAASSSGKVVIKVGDTPRSLLGSMREIASAGGLSSVETERLLAEITGSPALLGASNGAAVGDIHAHARARAMFIGSPALIDGNTLADNALRNWYTASDKLIDAKVLTALDGLSAQMGEVLRQQLMQPISLAAAEQVQQMLSVTGSAMASSLQGAIEPLARQMTQAITLPIRQSYLETISSVAGMVSSFEQVNAIAQRYAQFESTALAAGSVLSGLQLPIREPYVPTGTWQPLVQASEMMGIFDPDMPVAQRQRRPPAQPAAPDWREVLTVTVNEGIASPKDVIDWLHGMNLPGQKPADAERWAMIETAVAIYKERGHRYENQASFLVHLANRGIAISLPTFQRWLKEWEMTTGERVRSGRGSRKRRSM